jgi:hypothetical protein
MPNGKPGDHPLTDIVVYQAKVFGDEIDGKIRRIHERASPEIKSFLAALLWSWPRKNTNITSPILNSDELSHVLDKLMACVEIEH